MKTENKTKYIAPLLLLSAVGGAFTYRYLKARQLLFWKSKYNKEIHLIHNTQEWENIRHKFLKSCKDFRVIGLDCEWTFTRTITRPIALMQLANHQNICVLIRLCKFTEKIPDSLDQILRDPNILKVGVGVFDDAKKLNNDYGLLMRGCVDLRYVVQKHPKYNNIKFGGLKTLAKEIINVHLNKYSSVRCGNWEAEYLNPNQVNYAANDALISVQISKQLSLSITPFWSIVYGSSDEELMNCFLTLVNNNIIDKQFVQSNIKLEKLLNTASQKPMSREYSKTKVFRNGRLQLPNGDLLCMCDENKVNWYVKKDLAELISEEPLTAQLKFQPSFEQSKVDLYYLIEKNNNCVVCGKDGCSKWKHIVPSQYRIYFPEIMKNYQSHDILPLCFSCHEQSNYFDMKLHYQLMEECYVALETKDEPKFLLELDLKKIKSSSRILISRRHKLTIAQCEVLENTLKEYYKVDHLSEELVKKASEIDIRLLNENISHGFKVVYHMAKKNKLLEFHKRLRQHFLDSMNPKYLPPLWSVDHSHKTIQEKNIDVNADFLHSYANIVK